MQISPPEAGLSNAAPTPSFTPAFPVLGIYDAIVRVLSRDRIWRSALLASLGPAPGDVIVDAGCGTGTFLALVGASVPQATLIGVDPDPRILQRARQKLDDAGIAAVLKCGAFPDLTAVLEGRKAAKIVSSLVFHQVPMAEKRAGLAAMMTALAPGGIVLIADYGLQRTAVMRALFRLVQHVDGFEDTQPNADGILPILMEKAGFAGVAETHVFSTPTGSISIYRGYKP